MTGRSTVGRMGAGTSYPAFHAAMVAPSGRLRLPPVPGAKRAARRAETALFVGLLVLYLAVSRRDYAAYDAQSMVAVARSLVNHGTLRTTGSFVDVLHLSTPWSPYGLGLSLVVAPFYALSKLVKHETFVLSMINPLLTAATAVVMVRIGRRLGWSQRRAVLAGVAYGTLTGALQSTTELFSEPAVGLCIALIVLGILAWAEGRSWGIWTVGCAGAVAVQLRADSLFTVWVCVLALPLFVPWRVLLHRRTLVALGGPLVPSLVGLGWYNYVRYHSVFVSSYNGGTFRNPLSVGLHGLLWSPGKGLFVYDPIAIMGVVALGWLMVRRPPVGVLFTLLVVVRLLFFAKWSDWAGGICWGPRFLTPVLFLLVLTAFALLDAGPARSLLSTALTWSLAVLAAVSVPVSYLSVRVLYEQWWDILAVPSKRITFVHDGPLASPTASGRVLLHGVHFDIRTSPIYGDYVLLRDHAARMSPAFWRFGEGMAGWFVLVAATLLLLVSVLLARPERVVVRRDPPSPPRDHGPNR